METFNFSGASASASATGVPVRATGDIQDSSGVTFSVSYNASVFNADRGQFARILDDTGTGFRVSAGGVNDTFTLVPNSTPGGMFLSSVPVPISRPTNPDGASLVFELNATPSRAAFDTATNPVIVANGNNVTGSFTALPGGTALRFTFSNPSSNINISQLTVGFTCFCAGTRISTPDGACAVEEVTPGDLVCTADGRDVAVLWVGRQEVNTTFSNPAESNPIRITRGALGHGLPERDLRVSPDHAIAIDGYLINAGALVNSTTIYQENAIREDFTYYHIETEAHELILAEGVAAETYIDYTTRERFENAHGAKNRVIEEMPLLRISSARLLPSGLRERFYPAIAAE